MRVRWADLGPQIAQTWGRPRGRNQPEHFSIYGPSGSGKSQLQTVLLEDRARLRNTHCVIIATKPADSTLTALGWPIIDKWPPDYGQNRVIFWAKAPGLKRDALPKQQAAVARLLQGLWVPNSNRIVAFDEIAYVSADLRLDPMLKRYFREGRTLGLSVVSTTQRPAEVPRQMHSEAHWIAAFAPEDEDDRERVAQVFGNKRFYRDVLDSLDREKHEFLVIRKVTREAYITAIPKARVRG